MNVIDYFDPHSQEHLIAYQTLMDTGMWPKGYLPKGIEIPTHWNHSIMGKMVDAWIESKC